jgi:heme/copper-type cytochrome/quinol oxidase subunit 3
MSTRKTEYPLVQERLMLNEARAIQPVMNIAAIPIIGFGSTAPLWWGNLLMIVIEGMIFVLCIASYFYLRLEFREWPPPRVPYPNIVLGTVNVALLIISYLPFYLFQKKAERDDERGVKIWITVGVILGIASLVLRWYEFEGLYCRWDSDAYGSITWTTMGLHTVHLLAGTCETILLAVWAFTHKLDAKHRLDLEVMSYYWYFVVLSWVILYAVLYLSPRFI